MSVGSGGVSGGNDGLGGDHDSVSVESEGVSGGNDGPGGDHDSVSGRAAA